MVERGNTASEMREGVPPRLSGAPAVCTGGATASRWRVVGQCLCGLVLLLLANHLVFGSSGYFRWVAPESGAGSIGVAIGTLRHIPPDRTGILALGDSRVAEGFSAPIAQQVAMAQGAGYQFFNAAVPGTTPRVWYYLLRQLHEPRQHLAAVVVMLTSYHDNDAKTLADDGRDLAFVHPLLRLRDLADFPWSFPSAANRTRAVEAILLSGMFYGADLRHFLADPGERMRSVTGWRRHGYDWIRDYPGRDASLAGLAFNRRSGRLKLPPGRGIEQTSLLPAYADRLRGLDIQPPDNLDAANYRRVWLGRIAALCRQAHVRLFVYRIPRGPLEFLASPDDTATGALAELAAAGQLEVLPAELFASLERPEFFFDRLHLARAGRQRFSVMLAQAILQRLSAAR